MGAHRLTSLQLSSGDLLVDRRADYAEMLFANGEHATAAELMLGALELAPEWVLGWFRTGEMHEAAGTLDAAAEAWRMVLKLDPHDRAGARLKLELIGQAPASFAPSSRRCSTSMPPPSTGRWSRSCNTAGMNCFSMRSQKPDVGGLPVRWTSVAVPA